MKRKFLREEQEEKQREKEREEQEDKQRKKQEEKERERESEIKRKKLTLLTWSKLVSMIRSSVHFDLDVSTMSCVSLFWESIHQDQGSNQDQKGQHLITK